MIPPYITRDHVLAAMARIDKEGVPAGRQGAKFEVRQQGCKYPPKLLISLAHEEAKGTPLAPVLFTGGKETNGFLQSLGFTVARRGGTVLPAKTVTTISFPEPRQKLRPMKGITPGELESLRHQLVDVAKIYSWSELRADKNLPPSGPGVYAWFFKRPPSRVPSKGCVQREGQALLYVGISPESENSSQDLNKRIRYHFSGNAEGSTLRRTLGCLLEKEIGTILRRVGSGKRMTFDPNEGKLTQWMADNAAVSWVEVDAPWEVEPYLLSQLNLPLNIEGHSHNPFYDTLRAIRKRCRERARQLPVLEEC